MRCVPGFVLILCHKNVHLSFYSTLDVSMSHFDIGHHSMPHIHAVSSGRHSITFALHSTDVYELNGVLRNIIVFYQPVAVYTPTTTADVPPHVKEDVLQKVDLAAYNQRISEDTLSGAAFSGSETADSLNVLRDFVNGLALPQSKTER